MIKFKNMMKITFSKKQSLNFIQLIFLVLSVLVFNLKIQAQEYPFNLPNTITATLNVETTSSELFNNKLLGYNIEGFNTSLQKSFIKLVDPVTIRFPHGVWANFYEWQTDGYQQDSYDNGTHQNVLNTYVSSVKGHIAGIASLNNDKKDSNGGKGYDMMWTYAINFDDGPSSVARIKKDLGLGLEVKAIELGNEHFWTNQRSNRTSTPAKYLAEASAVSSAIKAEFPDIQLSIPLGWRRNQGNYNNSIIGNGTYFDAITIHKYLGADPDQPGESNSAYTSLLTAKLELEEDVNWVRNNYAPGKPVWLTEWGVSAGSDVHGGACLGMADAYLFMSENQQIFDRANWFSFNRVLNAMVEVGSNREPVYPLKKRGYFSTYQILQDVLRDATMLKSTVTSSAQLTTSRGSVNAVNARATTKDGKTSVLAINLTDKPVVFELKFNNIVYAGGFKHEALVFNNVGVVAAIDFYADPLTLIKQGGGTITLPALSISKITNISLDPAIKIIEGTIEAEEYKVGGQDVGYFDTNADNTLSAADDTDGVDVGLENGITYVGDTQNGEWLKYDVNILNTGNYDFEFVYAALTAGSLVSIEIDDVVLFDNFSLPQTSSLTDFQNAVKKDIELTQGLHVLKLNIQNGGFNLDKVNINFVGPLESPIFITPSEGSSIVPGGNIEVEATATLEATNIVSMQLFIDNAPVRTITNAPFKWGYDGQNDVLLANKSEGTYLLKIVLTDDRNRTSESSITVLVSNTPTQPYGGIAHTVPGIIQIEDYDIGGEGFAFHDSTVGNSGGEYRTAEGEDVDISAAGTGFVSGALSGNEYTRYTINVTQAGSYEMLVNYKTFSTVSKPFSARLLSPNLSTSRELFFAEAGSTNSGIIVIGAGVFGDYTSPIFDLQAGNWVLELLIPTGGAGPSYDYVTLNRLGALSTNNVNINEETLNVFPIPSRNGKFHLNKSHQWEVYSILGTLVKKGEGKSIDIAAFSKGMYILKTASGKTRRIIYN
jgi:hypothetical protein